MRVVFFGSGAFGVPTLERLWSDHEVAAVVSQPARPAGRRRTLTPTPVAAWTERHAPGAELLTPADVNEPAVRGALRGLGADAWVVIAFGQKLGRELVAGVFAVNLHASLLPRWRGAAPINHAVLAGDALTGNSVITIAPRMDAGDVLGRSERVLDPRSTAGEVHDALAADGPALVEAVLAREACGGTTREVQDESLVTLAPKLSRSDGWVDFRGGSASCRRRVHGLTPWPGVTVRLEGGGVACELKLLRVGAEEGGGVGAAAGSLVDVEGGVVSCGDGTSLRLLEVQPAGKRVMVWEEFVRGRRLVGSSGAGLRLIGRSDGS